MRRSIGVALVLATGTAAAAPPPLVIEPSGWKVIALDPHAKDTSIVDAATKTAVSEQFMPPEPDPGIALFVTRATAGDLRSPREVAIRALADELQENARRGTSVEYTPVKAADHLELTASWRDAGLHTIRTTRLVIAADATHLVTVTGECLARDDIAAARIEACKAALATLDPDLPKADRVGLELPEAGLAPTPTPPPTSTSPTIGPARLDDGTRVPFPPITVAPNAQAQADRRPVYVGAGVVMLALAFWWNRRRRDRFDREDQPPRRRRRKPEDARSDADADDLHAAARGDEPEQEIEKVEDSDER